MIRKNMHLLAISMLMLNVISLNASADEGIHDFSDVWMTEETKEKFGQVIGACSPDTFPMGEYRVGKDHTPVCPETVAPESSIDKIQELSSASRRFVQNESQNFLASDLYKSMPELSRQRLIEILESLENEHLESKPGRLQANDLHHEAMRLCFNSDPLLRRDCAYRVHSAFKSYMLLSREM